MRRWAAAAATLLAVMPCACESWAASVRPLTQIIGASVHLSDLFSGLAPGQDCVLGDSPAPGRRFVIAQPQLEAIASQFGVDWEPLGGSQTVILDRPGRIVDENTVATLVGSALAKQAPGRLSLSLSDYQPMTVDRDAEVGVDEVMVEPTTGEVRATLTASVAGHVLQEQPVSGRMDRIVSLPTPIRPIVAGDVLDEQELVSRDFPASHVRGDVLVSAAAAVGLVSTRYLAPGEPIGRSDLKQPDLVSRGGPVRMDLDASGIELTAQGTALEAGGINDRVRVLNPTSRAILFAWVTGRNEVRVDAASFPLSSGQTSQLPDVTLLSATNRYQHGAGQ